MEEGIRHPEDFTGIMRDGLLLKDVEANEFSPLVLAYIGDAVYELIIRTKVINYGNMQVNKLHRKSAGLVKAGTQANLIKAISGQLTEEERRIYKRGRNAKSFTVAKHATMTDYRMATGFEALVGYLYLDGRYERLIALIWSGLEMIEEFS